jgi:hypothetical protein
MQLSIAGCIFYLKNFIMPTLVAENQVQPKRKQGCFRFLVYLLIIVILASAGYFYWRYYFVFGEGVKSGVLNYAVKKGQLFKTYEGKLIQEGIGRGKTDGSIQSNEFEFSIESKRIFDTLAIHSGKRFDLHYKEFNGIIPWRGNTRYVVDSILSMTTPPPSSTF